MFLSEFPYKIISMTFDSFEWTIFYYIYYLYLIKINADTKFVIVMLHNVALWYNFVWWCLWFFFNFSAWNSDWKALQHQNSSKILWSLPTDNFFKAFIWFIQWILATTNEVISKLNGKFGIGVIPVLFFYPRSASRWFFFLQNTLMSHESG